MDKLKELNKKIQNYKREQHKKLPKNNNLNLGAFNVALEIITSVAVGLLMGFHLDKFFGMKVTFKIICLLLAFIASLVNIYRRMKQN